MCLSFVYCQRFSTVVRALKLLWSTLGRMNFNELLVFHELFTLGTILLNTHDFLIIEVCHKSLVQVSESFITSTRRTLWMTFKLDLLINTWLTKCAHFTTDALFWLEECLLTYCTFIICENLLVLIN